MFVSYQETLKLISENSPFIINESNKRLSVTKDESSVANRFTTKPRGIIIQDTYNNLFFPIQPRPQIDTNKLDILEITKRFRELYKTFETLLLPWHFVVEFVENRYYIFNTRPVDLKFPLSMNEAIKMVKDKRRDLDDITKQYFKRQPFPISEAIHVAIVGDTTLDVYTKKTYEIIGKFAILPFVRYFKLPEGIGQSIYPLNVGKKFNTNYVVKFIRK